MTLNEPGATSSTYTISAVSRANNDLYVSLVVSADGGDFQTTPVQLMVQPTITDPGFRACLVQMVGANFSMDDLTTNTLTNLDCSNRGIVSLADISLIRPATVLNLSGNLITDLPPIEAGGHILVGTRRVPVLRTYEEVMPGEVLAYVGSAGTIEVAVRDGRADTILNMTRGDKIHPDADGTGPYR